MSIGKICVIFPLILVWYILKACFYIASWILKAALFFPKILLEIICFPFRLILKIPFYRMIPWFNEYEPEEPEEPETDLKTELKRQKLEYQIQENRTQYEHSLSLIYQYSKLLDRTKTDNKRITIENKIYSEKKKAAKAKNNVILALKQLNNMDPE